jgi:glycosyltransferase involved in cell wall biosynthesis
MNTAAVKSTAIRPPLIDIVIPVYNEERDLEPGVRRLRAHLDAGFPFPAVITIADNASTDGTRVVGMRLAAELPSVRYLRLERRGRGRALTAAWLRSQAGVVAYMDVDLSTGLGALLPLVEPLVNGQSDLAIGSRLAAGSHVRRGLKRELISRTYNLLLRLALGVRFTDAQCGFKALRADVARRLVPRVENRSWFFDTELLVLAERSGLRVHEVPVDWVDDPDTRVRIVATALEDLRGVWRLRGSRTRRGQDLPGGVWRPRGSRASRAQDLPGGVWRPRGSRASRAQDLPAHGDRLSGARQGSWAPRARQPQVMDINVHN